MENAQQIQSRLERLAADVFQRLTGKRTDHLQGFDPLVFMMLGACSSEFEKIQHELADSQERMLEKLAGFLSPEVDTTARPACTMIHLPALAGKTTVGRQDEFRMFPQEKGEMSLTPAGNFEVSDLAVRYLGVGQSLHRILPSLQRDPISAPRSSTPLGDSVTCFIGVEVPDYSMLPDRLTFFIDSTAPRIRSFIESLEFYTRWLHRGQALEMKGGIPQVDAEAFWGNLDHRPYQLEHEVREGFNSQFLGFETAILPKEQDSIPLPLRKSLAPEVLAEMKEECIWLEVECILPESMRNIQETDFLEEFSITLNAVPALNRDLHKRQYQLSKEVNLFPLPADGFFNEVEEVISSSSNTRYFEKPYFVLMEDEKSLEGVKAFTLRRDGVSRFDERDASELLVKVNQKVREEGRVFSAVGKTGVARNVQNLQKELHQLELRMKSLKNQEGSVEDVFIGFPPATRERVIVRYWSTKGFDGNFVPKNTSVAPADLSDLDQIGMQTLVLSQGGKSPLTASEKLTAYRSALIGHDRISTEAEIKAFCQAEAGPHLEDVVIREVVRPGKSAKSGLQRMLLVELIPTSQHTQGSFSWESWDGMVDHISLALKEKSNLLLPIVIEINSPA